MSHFIRASDPDRFKAILMYYSEAKWDILPGKSNRDIFTTAEVDKMVCQLQRS